MGLLLKAEEDEGFRIFASSDHALYSPYVVVRLKTRPESLERTEAGSPDGDFKACRPQKCGLTSEVIQCQEQAGHRPISVEGGMCML